MTPDRGLQRVGNGDPAGGDALVKLNGYLKRSQLVDHPLVSFKGDFADCCRLRTGFGVREQLATQFLIPSLQLQGDRGRGQSERLRRGGNPAALPDGGKGAHLME